MFRKITLWLQTNRRRDVKADGRLQNGDLKKKKHTASGLDLSTERELSISTSNEISSSNLPEVEVVQLTEEQKKILKRSWFVIYSELGQSLCYVGGNDPVGSDRNEVQGQGAHRGVAETFFRLFEEYPQSKTFFAHFGETNSENWQSDLKMTRALQEHAVRVMQVVEKVIGRINDLEKTKGFLLNLGRYHRHTGVPSDYFGVMGTIFLHASRPYLEKNDMWTEDVEDAWMELFGHIARVMTFGQLHFHHAKEA